MTGGGQDLMNKSVMAVGDSAASLLRSEPFFPALPHFQCLVAREHLRNHRLFEIKRSPD